MLGKRTDGAEERVEPYGLSVLVAGTSGSGKSTLTKGLLERLAVAGYQYVIVDPEGDYDGFEGAVTLGDIQRAGADEVVNSLELAGNNVVVNLLGLPLEHRPAFFDGLLPRVQELRTDRPAALACRGRGPPLAPDRSRRSNVPRQTRQFAVHHRPPRERRTLGAGIGRPGARGRQQTGGNAGQLRPRCRPKPPKVTPTELQPGETLAWRPESEPVKVKSEPPQAEHRRHSRKYAEGSVGPDRSFVFRGPAAKLNLRAQNLQLFLQMADGVDDETWQHHLNRREYSAWFRDAIKDDELGMEVEKIEAGDCGNWPRRCRRRVYVLLSG